MTLVGHKMYAPKGIGLDAAPAIAASTGSACHSGTHTPSPVLTAMGIKSTKALASIRVSLGRWTTTNDINHAATALITAARRGFTL